MCKNEMITMLKKFTFILLFFPTLMWSQQESGLGILAGVNFASNGELIDETTNVAENPSRNVGYHFGLFGKADFGKIFIRPELKYTHTKSAYSRADLTIDKLDAPILIGFDFLQHLSVFAGPSLQYILDTDFGDFSIENTQEDFTVGLQVGIGLNIEAIGIDLRYERGLNENEADLNEFTQTRVDTRPDQLILAVSLSI